MDSKTLKIVAIVVVVVIVVAAVGAYLVSNDGDDDDSRELLTDALEVFGNANNDWTIDQDDVDFIQSIVDGETEWDSDANPYADANNDGVITQADVEQARALANDTAETVWIYDGVGTLMEVGCQPERVYVYQVQNAEIATIMGYGNNIVAGGTPVEFYEPFLFPDNPHDVQYFASDYERLSELDIDLYLVFSPSQIETPAEMLPNTDVVYLGLYYPEIADMESSAFAQGILKAGYIFGVKDRAEGYLEFLLDIRDTIYSYTSTLDDSEKPNVLASSAGGYLESEDSNELTVYLKRDTISQAIELAGGLNVASSFDNFDSLDTYSVTTEAEWLDTVDIDFITVHYNYYGWSGIDTSLPEGGYTATDSSGMYEYIDMIASRPLIETDRDHIIMLPQENRNGSTGGIAAAMYLLKAFHPDLAADFDPDEYMEEYITVWLGIEDYDYSEHEDAIIAWGDRYSNDTSTLSELEARRDRDRPTKIHSRLDGHE